MSAVAARRPVEAGDAGFLRGLFLACRPGLALLPGELVDLQLAAQSRQYTAAHPSAVDVLLLEGRVPVGRCWYDEARDATHVLDLAVLPEHRGRGHARAALGDLAARAARRGVPLRLSVRADNHPALALYRSLGLEVEHATADRLQLVRHPDTPTEV